MSIGGGGAPKQKPTKSEKALALIAARKHQDYLTRGIPVENLANSELLRRASPSERERIEGLTAATVQQASGIDAPSDVIDPMGGVNLGAVAKRGVMRGTGLALGVGDADVQAKQQGAAASEAVFRRGRGLEAIGIDALSNQASAERIRQAGKQQAEAIRSAGWGDAIGTVAGFALQRYTGGAGGPVAGGAANGVGSSQIPSLAPKVGGYGVGTSPNTLGLGYGNPHSGV